MINESKKAKKFFNDTFQAVASNYLLHKYNITVEDIAHTNLKQFYLSLVGYIENLMWITDDYHALQLANNSLSEIYVTFDQSLNFPAGFPQWQHLCIQVHILYQLQQ